uniref:Uncharacterized protein n=1 Tax=viral metagenome TaxID=1070528 RepID=A0A6M3K829_9ZZZZ
MGYFKNNPKKPFEVRVPNKIRKRIAMHEETPVYVKPPIRSATEILRRRYKRDSLWSRFVNRLKKFLG